EVVGFPLLICSNAKDSGLYSASKDLSELKDLVKVRAAIGPNHMRLSNFKPPSTWISPLKGVGTRLLKTLLFILSCKYYNSLPPCKRSREATNSIFCFFNF